MSTKRKKWTPREDIDDTLIRFREKRKWQLAFRRYVLERNLSQGYAPYFGLDINRYRDWIALQFKEDLSWENFGSAWQFHHVIPVEYFDFNLADDLKLCWNFINIRVEKLGEHNENLIKVDILAAKAYFEDIYIKTSYPLAHKMVEKINQLQSGVVCEPELEAFLLQNKNYLEKVADLSPGDFAHMNKGVELNDILLEKEIIRKFG